MIVLAVTMASAEDVGPAVQVAGAQPPVFSSRAELVVAHVTVKDRDGHYVTGLRQEAFRVFEDGARQRIAFFTGEESPVTVGVLVGSSGSTREGRDRVIDAATARSNGDVCAVSNGLSPTAGESSFSA